MHPFIFTILRLKSGAKKMAWLQTTETKLIQDNSRKKKKFLHLSLKRVLQLRRKTECTTPFGHKRRTLVVDAEDDACASRPARASLPSDGVNRADDLWRSREKLARPEFEKVEKRFGRKIKNRPIDVDGSKTPFAMCSWVARQ